MISAFCADYLSPIRVSPKALTGGLLHKLFTVEDEKGTWVIKQIDPRESYHHATIEDYELTERIAQGFANKQIPAVAAKMLNHRLVHLFQNNYFIIYPYISGVKLAYDEISQGHAKKLGAVFGQMHNITPVETEIAKAKYDVYDAVDWHEITNKSNKKSYYQDLNSLLPFILACNARYLASLSELRAGSVISHRDCHKDNVLWDAAGNLHLLDWESAGAVNPTLEIIGIALEWSGLMSGMLREDIAKQMIASYKQQTTQLACSAEAALYGFLGHFLLGWLFFNLRRSLGQIGVDPARGEAVVQPMLDMLGFLSSNINQFEKLVHELLPE